MENYVRRCALFAIIWLLVGLVFCLLGFVHGNSKLATASEDLTAQAVTEENVNLVARIRPAKDDAKLPDEGRPKHATAVEPPTKMVTINSAAVSIVELADTTVGKTVKKPVEDPVEMQAPTETAPVVEEITETVIESPKFASAPVATAATSVLFYGGNRYATITLTEEQNELLARLIYHECRGIGGAAVAETVFNRMLSGEFPSTIEDVIYMKNAFSPSGILWTASIDEPEALERCREIPREVLSGDTYLLPSTDYCYFHAGHATLEGDYEYGGNVFYADYAAHH